MLTRRNFFWSSAAALVAGRVSPALAQGAAVPRSLAALTSMRAQAKPITNAERRARSTRSTR